MKFESVDEYISSVPGIARTKLELLRTTIKRLAPEAEELISYNMPAFKFHGILVYYAAHKEHVGLYPGNAMVVEVFKEALIGYNSSKGTIQFPLKNDLPVALIENIIKFRVEQNLDRATKLIKKKK